MTICVVGGAGFIGRRIIRLLAAEGEQVVCLDIARPSGLDDLGAQLRVERVDLTQFEDIVSALIRHRPKAVINLSYMLGDYLPHPAVRLNILGMDNCFEAARLCDVGRVVYASSIAVNGNQAFYGNRPILETDPTTTAKQYAVHKVFNEWQAREYCEKHGMSVIGVRAANVAGIDKVLGSVDHVRCVVGPALGEKVVLPFRDRTRCVIHADDIAQIFVTLALAKAPQHRIYNSGGDSLSLGRIAEMVRAQIPDADITFEQESGGEGNFGAYIFSNERLTGEFSLRIPSYEERIPMMIDEARRGARRPPEHAA